MGKDIKLSAQDKQFPAYEAEPGREARGGVIVIEEIWGLKPHIKSIADRVSTEGYLALSPDLLSETKIEKMVDDELMKSLFNPERRSAVQPKLREVMAPIQAPDFAAGAMLKLQSAYDYLAGKVGDNIAVMGFCFGGSYSFQLAMDEPKLKAAIPFYGHIDAGLDDLRSIKCPILALYGEKDERLVAGLPELEANMKQAGVDFQAVVYPNCGHAFFNDTNEFAYNASAATDAWQKTLEFLSANLTV